MVRIFREANFCADGVSKWVLHHEIGYHLLKDPPPCVLHWLHMDMQGVSIIDWLNIPLFNILIVLAAASYVDQKK